MLHEGRGGDDGCGSVNLIPDQQLHTKIINKWPYSKQQIGGDAERNSSEFTAASGPVFVTGCTRTAHQGLCEEQQRGLLVYLRCLKQTDQPAMHLIRTDLMSVISFYGSSSEERAFPERLTRGRKYRTKIFSIADVFRLNINVQWEASGHLDFPV